MRLQEDKAVSLILNIPLNEIERILIFVKTY